MELTQLDEHDPNHFNSSDVEGSEQPFSFRERAETTNKEGQKSLFLLSPNTNSDNTPLDVFSDKKNPSFPSPSAGNLVHPTLGKYKRNTPPFTTIAFINRSSGGGDTQTDSAASHVYDYLCLCLNPTPVYDESKKSEAKKKLTTYVFDLRKCGGSLVSIFSGFLLDCENVRVIAAGGDGTMGWILSSIDRGRKESFVSEESSLPLAMVPLGTGNDLARTFRWGGTPPSWTMKGGKKRTLTKRTLVDYVTSGEINMLDRWRLVIVPFMKKDLDLEGVDVSITSSLQEHENVQSREGVPQMLGTQDRGQSIVGDSGGEELWGKFENFFNGDGGEGAEEGVDEGTGTGTRTGAKDEDEDEAETRTSQRLSYRETQSQTRQSTTNIFKQQQKISHRTFDGIFTNYFSIGLDAQVAMAFHQERNAFPERFTSPLKNKVKYVEKGFQNGLFSPNPKKLPMCLNTVLQVLVKDDKNGGELRELKLPKNTRGLALLNIQSYGGGNKMTRRGSITDGLIEVVCFTHPLRMAVAASVGRAVPFVRVPIKSKASQVIICAREDVFMQVDGEPWLQSQGVFQVSFHSSAPIIKRKSGGNGVNCCC
ncbi:hypothetical protein ScalyP_jg2702 [Parmales sp. scaly parma]|nr:hypothetical protein ScalyP_jg2702 [Parmales sp. scaly parma]